MSATFSVKQLPKTDSSLTRLPNFHKYYISCSGRITHKTPITVTTDAWLNVLKSIKVDSDLDKSRVLMEKYGEMVIRPAGI
jgi:hypothetical protein